MYKEYVYTEGKIILDARLSKNWSRRELSERSGVSEDTIFRIEMRNSGFLYGTMELLACALELTDVRFMGRITSAGNLLDESFFDALTAMRKKDISSAKTSVEQFNKDYEKWKNGISKTKNTIKNRRQWFEMLHNVLNLSFEYLWCDGKVGITFVRRCEQAIFRCGYSLDDVNVSARHLTEPEQRLLNLMALAYMKNGDYGRSIEISESLFLCLRHDLSRICYSETIAGKIAVVACNIAVCEYQRGNTKKAEKNMRECMSFAGEGASQRVVFEIIKAKERFFPFLEMWEYGICSNLDMYNWPGKQSKNKGFREENVSLYKGILIL